MKNSTIKFDGINNNDNKINKVETNKNVEKDNKVENKELEDL